MRTASRLLVLVAGLTVPVLATACVPADALRPKIPSTLDGALAEVAHPALDWASGFFSGAGVITPAIIPGRCTFDAASQYFVCTPLTARTLTLNQRFTLLDASGARQSAFDSATTAGLHLENAVTGEWEDTTAIDGQ